MFSAHGVSTAKTDRQTERQMNKQETMLDALSIIR